MSKLVVKKEKLDLTFDNIKLKNIGIGNMRVGLRPTIIPPASLTS